MMFCFLLYVACMVEIVSLRVLDLIQTFTKAVCFLNMTIPTVSAKHNVHYIAIFEVKITFAFSGMIFARF